MNPREEKLLQFVALRLDSLVRRPALWGPDAVVEEQVLQLVEMRRLLLDPTAQPSNDTRELMDCYLGFLAQQFEMPIATSLAEHLQREGRSSELGTILHKFVDEELAAFVAAAPGVPAADAQDTESEDRTIAILSRVKRWIANVAAVERARAHRVDHMPLLFPAQEPR